MLRPFVEGELKLCGIKAAFNEIMAMAVEPARPQRTVGDLLNAEITEKQARSIKYQLTIAKLPLAKDLDDFQFWGTPINEYSCVTSPAVGSSPSRATPSRSAGLPTRPIWPLPLPEA